MKKKKAKQLSYPIKNLLYFASKGTPPPRLVTPDDFEKRKKFPNDPKWDQSKVPEAIAKIRKIFDSLIEEKKLIDSEELQYFIDIALQYTTKSLLSKINQNSPFWTDKCLILHDVIFQQKFRLPYTANAVQNRQPFAIGYFQHKISP